MEIKVAAREIVPQLKDIRLAIAPQDITYLPTLATHTIETLPLTFRRRA
jgi:cytochrome P450